MPPTLELPSARRTARTRLLGKLRSECRAGDRLPPIADLAGELGIGQGSVAHAVRELARQGVLISRPRLGTFVADVPLRGDDYQTATATKRVGLITAIALDGMIVRICDAITEALAKHGHVTTLRRTAYPGPEKPTDDDAVIFINPSSQMKPVLRDGQVALIINTAPESPQIIGAPYDLVTVDQESGPALAGAHLRKVGCKHVCYVGVRHRHHRDQLGVTSMMRLEGFERGWGERIPASRRLAAYAYGEGSGAQIVPQFATMNPRPDAIFAVTDEVAVGFVKGAYGLGLQPGRDYHIIGFDGQDRGRDMGGARLTTIEAPAAEMGRRGAELLIDRFQHPDQPTRRVSLECTLAEGTTVHHHSS